MSKRKLPVMDFWTKELFPLVGGEVTQVLRDDNDEYDVYYGLRILKTDGEQQTMYDVWFLRDEEGNGPGCPQINEEALE